MVQVAHQRDGGIGTLGEKSIHAILKCYFDGNPDNHEQSVGESVADIVGEYGVIEIQTRQFRRLDTKLTDLLPICPVTVVYPVIRRKRILWMDPDTGELLRSGTMRAFQKPADVFAELCQIRNHITHPNFNLCLVELEAEDYRLADGYGKDRRGRATKIDRIPTALIDVKWFSCPDDYAQFLPIALPKQFTSADVAKQAKTTRSTAQAMLRVMVHMGLVTLTEKAGRTNIYRRNNGFG